MPRQYHNVGGGEERELDSGHAMHGFFSKKAIRPENGSGEEGELN